MIETGQKTSLLIPSQLPEFIRDEPAYANFVLFLQAYYEWMEETGQVTDRTKNILNYTDIDKTSSEFLQYFYNDFLSYFPEEILADKVKVTKLAKQLYQSKGTQSAYKFLFRVLFNTDVDFFYTKDAVLRASAGKWYVAKSLRLDSNDINFLKVNNYRVFGETTKSIGTIENVVISGTKSEVFISNIERLFQSGEIVRVVDSNNQDVLFDGLPLKAKVLGQISQVKIDPNNRGSLYLPGDPVIVYGGLTSNTGIGASAVVGSTTKGSIQRIKVETGGYGYREDPNTTIDILNSGGAIAVVGSVDPSANSIANVSFIPTDVISSKRLITIGASNYFFANVVNANANTTLANAFSYTAFSTYPISSVLVTFGGGGITQTPTVSAESLYTNETGQSDLGSLGILAPIQIRNAGLGYEANDTIVISGGLGYGAHANVISVNSSGSIETVSYVYPNEVYHSYPLGGLGYRESSLPTLTVNSVNVSATGADLYVPGILGSGATFTSITDRVGAITNITITNPGEDYISTPNVSLKVQDIVVTGVSIADLPEDGDVAYQGVDFDNTSYKSFVDSVTLLSPNGDPSLSVYVLRVYNYNAVPNASLPIKINGKIIELTIASSYGGKYGASGVISYGNGTAKANASFLNGLVISQGQYLDTTGQPSSYDVLQSEIYNNYTYQITLEKEIASYRETLLNLLHPTGMNVLGRYALKSNSAYQTTGDSILETGHTLGFYTGDPGSYATMTTDWENQSNNIIEFHALVGANLEQIIFVGDSVTLTTANGFKIHSEVTSVTNGDANTVTLKDNTWLTFANVAYITANSGTDVINISSLTGSYDIINNGQYSNTSYPLKDIVYAGDVVLIANNTERTVTSVNYINGTISLDSNLTNDAISLMSVKRTISTALVQIDGPVGTVFYPELTDELGRIITTEDGKSILLG